jgi:RecB family exonuclease
MKNNTIVNLAEKIDNLAESLADCIVYRQKKQGLKKFKPEQSYNVSKKYYSMQIKGAVEC